MSRILKRFEVAGRRLLFRAIAPAARAGERTCRIPSDSVPESILLLRQDRIGDMIMTLPLLRQLRELYPHCRIGVVCSESNRIILRYEKDFHLIEYRKSPLAFLGSLYQTMCFGPYCSVDMHMHDSTTSFIYAWVSAAQWNLHVNWRNVLPFNVRVSIPLNVHIMEAFTGLLEGLGKSLDLEDMDREVTLSSDEKEFARAFCRRLSVPRKRIVTVNISAGGANRWWGVDKYVALCRGIHSMGFTPLIMSSPEHHGRAREIASSAESAILAPVTQTVLHLAALLKGSRLLVSPDTAAVHLAASMNVPVVGMYLKPDPSLPGWHPWRVPCDVLVSDQTFSLGSIEPQSVIDSVFGMLKSGEGNPE